MRINRSTSFLATLAVAAILTGCGSTGIGDIFGGGSNRDTGSTSGRYEQGSDVRGTVDRVDTLDRRIFINREGGDSRYLRNGGSDQVVIYYDDRTTVEYEGQTYNPQDLERGDRIAAEVDESGNRLMAYQIEVLYDSTAGDSRADTTYDDNRNDTYRNDTYQNNDYRVGDELRGIVRYVDTRARTLEIEPMRSASRSTTTGRSNRIVVHYDSGTTVEFEGRSFRPENLEQGDEVEIELGGSTSRLTAEEIVVLNDSRSSR